MNCKINFYKIETTFNRQGKLRVIANVKNCINLSETYACIMPANMELNKSNIENEIRRQLGLEDHQELFISQ